MAFQLTTRALGEVTVIDLSGRLEPGRGSTVLGETLRTISAGGGKILLNLRDVSFIDTSGLGELASAHARSQSEGKTPGLIGIPKRVEKLLQMTGVHGIPDICDDEAEAIHSWGSSFIGLNAVRTASNSSA